MSAYFQKFRLLFLNRYLLFILALILATEIFQQFGGLPALRHAWRLEIPLLLYLYWLSNRMLRPSRRQPWLAAIPGALLYVIFDLYHMQFGRLLRISEVAQIPELIQILTPSIRLAAFLAVGLPLTLFMRAVAWRRWKSTLAAALPLLALCLSIGFYPAGFMAVFAQAQTDMVFYSDTKSARANGRLAMMLYNEAKRRGYLQETARYLGDTPYLKKYAKLANQIRRQPDKRNVHLVVLESFLDPSLLGAAHFSQDPAHPEFAELFGGKGSLSISPVFGGGTAQAEFEVLCGVPAMRELSGIEFDVFTGSPTPCLPYLLAEGGYQTLASNAYKPDFFNSTNAYAGMGFNGIFYPQEFAPASESYFGTGDVGKEIYMFDGKLLDSNLAFIAEKIRASKGRPIFNYIIGMYGHLPHILDETKRPKVVRVEGASQVGQLERAVNQYYYRTEAIAEFVQGLMRIDPESLVILVSDHLPTLDQGPTTYRSLNYLAGVEGDIHLNRIYFIENGQVTRRRTINHYDVPQIILDYVTRGEYCRDGDCDFTPEETPEEKTVYREEYLTIMARAML
ncbi:sulfatase-like hydrolase/transferase [Trichloromonas sp.]|uniref:sulfatase-like hydrolase/transferase n=1 Tax=Trichloromonas sp. TaxID=3069249 RepID=UPI002A485D0E|nr:sulfatase-like hydrolase/transferase [Trichloromonas sp.]